MRGENLRVGVPLVLHRRRPIGPRLELNGDVHLVISCPEAEQRDPDELRVHDPTDARRMKSPLRYGAGAEPEDACRTCRPERRERPSALIRMTKVPPRFVALPRSRRYPARRTTRGSTRAHERRIPARQP